MKGQRFIGPQGKLALLAVLVVVLFLMASGAWGAEPPMYIPLGAEIELQVPVTPPVDGWMWTIWPPEQFPDPTVYGCWAPPLVFECPITVYFGLCGEYQVYAVNYWGGQPVNEWMWTYVTVEHLIWYDGFESGWTMYWGMVWP